MTDYRSDRMPSSEGRGKAKQAWDAYHSAATKFVVEPLFGSAIKSYSASAVADLIGFWVLWHLEGGFEGLRRLGMSRASIFRKVAAFRRIFKVHPDEFEIPGINLDLAEYRAGSARLQQTEAEGSDA